MSRQASRFCFYDMYIRLVWRRLCIRQCNLYLYNRPNNITWSTSQPYGLFELFQCAESKRYNCRKTNFSFSHAGQLPSLPFKLQETADHNPSLYQALFAQYAALQEDNH